MECKEDSLGRRSNKRCCSLFPTLAVRDLDVIYGWDPSPQDSQVPGAEYGLPTALWEGDAILASRARSGLLRPPPQRPAKDGPHCATPFPMTQRGNK